MCHTIDRAAKCEFYWQGIASVSTECYTDVESSSKQCSVFKLRCIMLSTQELIAEAVSLPVEERAIVVDSLLRSLNPPNEDTDRKWAAVAKRRLTELRSGQVKGIPGDEVFARIRKRFVR